MGVKLKADYGAVLHMPVLKEGKDRVSQLPGSMQSQQSYAQHGEDETNVALAHAQYDGFSTLGVVTSIFSLSLFFIYV